MTLSPDPLAPSTSFLQPLLCFRSEVRCAHCPIFWSLSTSGGFQATVATGSDVRPTGLAPLGCAQTWLCSEASSQLPSAGPVFGLVLGGGNQVASVIAYSQLLVILCGHPVARGGGAGRPSRSCFPQTSSAAEARNFCESTRRAPLASRFAYVAQRAGGQRGAGALSSLLSALPDTQNICAGQPSCHRQTQPPWSCFPDEARFSLLGRRWPRAQLSAADQQVRLPLPLSQ